MKLIIDIPWQVKATLNREEQWTALLLVELQDIINNGTPIEQEPCERKSADREFLKEFLDWYTIPFNDATLCTTDETIDKFFEYRERRNGDE